MPTVHIYIDDDCWGGLALLTKEAFAIAGTLNARNADLAQAELFQVRLVGLGRAPVRSFTGPLLVPEASLRGPRPDVIVIPPFYFRDEAPTLLPARLRSWLLQAYEAGTLLLCMASGVRVLAATGLLDGREATGNLSDQRVFARDYPQVRFVPETPLVIDDRIVTAASINPCMDACAYLVNHFVGEAAAHKFSRYTNSFSHPSYEKTALKNVAWKQHGDARIRQAQEYMERYFKQDLSVADAARRAAMSVRNFSRRFQAAVGMSAHSYMTRCRVEHAKDLLVQPGVSMLQVSLRCGLRNEVTLRRAFGQHAAMTPAQYRAGAALRPAG